MRITKKITLIILVLVISFIVHTLVSTGFFRTVENQFDGKIVKKVALPGTEDITISYVDSFALISSTNRQVYPPKEEERGGLYFMELKSGNFKTIHLTASLKKPFAPHGISMIKKDSTYTIMAINHTLEGHSIEVFSLHNENLTHKKSITDASLKSPNDIVLIDKNRFYVASPRGFEIKVYSRDTDGLLDFIEDIPCGTGVDNIEIDKEGSLWSGAHPNLLRFKAYAQGKENTSPSEVIKVTYREKNDYLVEKVYVEDGEVMSGSSSAAAFGDLILTGNVMDDEFLILKKGK